MTIKAIYKNEENPVQIQHKKCIDIKLNVKRAKWKHEFNEYEVAYYTKNSSREL